MAESAISHIKQQNVPLWGTERIVESRNDHLAVTRQGSATTEERSKH
jgi:hypothetical protein